MKKPWLNPIKPVSAHKPTRFALPSAEVQKNWDESVQHRLEPIPQPWRDPVMNLSEIIGAESVQEIEAYGALSFHAVGDTGNGPRSPQEDVAQAMGMDYKLHHPEKSPAFLFHLGDLIYGLNKSDLYADQFYVPYSRYPGKIIAIPGNHDSETLTGTDPKSCAAFLENFCDPTPSVPPIAGHLYRETMNLPGTYWMLRCPFADIIGLNTNAGETEGNLGGPVDGTHQETWLRAALKSLAHERKNHPAKWLIIGTHHPAYSLCEKGGSRELLAATDRLFNEAGIWPDLWLSGHAHLYQHLQRKHRFADGTKKTTHHFVAGTGGRGLDKMNAKPGAKQGEAKLKAVHQTYGYLRIKVNENSIKARFYGDAPKQKLLDEVAIERPRTAKE
jgi:hypothetical protein